MKQPNIILIMTDQLRGDCLGYAGHPDVKTPYLDTLASRGVVFDRAYSACPNCVAARAPPCTPAFPPSTRAASATRTASRGTTPRRWPASSPKRAITRSCCGKMHVAPLRNYIGFHNVDLHDGYMHAARYGSVPYRESQFVADDYFHDLKKKYGADADVTLTGLDCNSYLAARGFTTKRTTRRTG